MNASLVFDQSRSTTFTNLDFISGKVVLKCSKSADLDSIVVKLEGESRTRLLSPTAPGGEKQRPQLEYHKILYKVQTVFPPQDVLRGRMNYGSAKTASTVPPGTHEYPFSFKLPFNNSCAIEQKSLTPMLNISGSGVEFAKTPTKHVKKTLPPTMSGFPGEAEIRYFVKATVSRHGFWKENPRVYVPFNFLPIEPPKLEITRSEVFARQKHSFCLFPEGHDTKSKVKNYLSKSKESDAPGIANIAPQISVDARLPEPAILTCNNDIPLRLLVKKMNNSDHIVSLESLEIALIGQTKIRAHEVYRTESNSWVIISKSNMSIPIGAATDPANTEIAIDNSLWRGEPLPSSVAPSFFTCNIERAYQLDVRVGLSYSGTVRSTPKPQTILLPMRLDVEVYSGIAPPKELLEAMAEAKAGIRRPTKADRGKTLGEKLQTNLRMDSAASIPPTPMEPFSHDGISDRPAQEGNSVPPAPAPSYPDAPPSYEDAVASSLPPIVAQRPNYAPPSVEEDELLGGDEKKSFGGRRESR